jgi:uncharacterized membrane protein YozB (DUF420 family)
VEALVFLAVGLVLSALAVPFAAVAIHQGRRRRYERAAAFRRKPRIEL